MPWTKGARPLRSERYCTRIASPALETTSKPGSAALGMFDLIEACMRSRLDKKVSRSSPAIWSTRP